MKTFIIDRAIWRSGGESVNKTGYNEVSLLSGSGFMCCLGQVCKQLGHKFEADTAESPQDLDVLIPDFTEISPPSSHYYIDTRLSKEAMAINDDPSITRKKREKKLKKLFKKYGYILEFIGKAVK